MRIILFGKIFRPALRKNMAFSAAMRTDKHTHVLHDTEYGHMNLAEHGHALASIGKRKILRCRDDHRSRDRHVLRQGELRIAGTGG